LDRTRWILKRREAALTRKQNWGSILQKTYRLSQPNRNVFDLRPIGEDPQTFDVQGQDIQWYVFDLTLSHATDVFVNRMVNALCPAGKKWLSFAPGTDIPDDAKEMVTKELQKRTDLFFKYIHQSNFQSIIYECFMDMAVSTGFLTINEGSTAEKPLIFASNPPDCIYADEGPWGTFDAYYRDWNKLPLTHAEVMWPKFRVPDKLVENDDGEVLITVYEIMYYDYDKERWQYLVIHADTKTICYERTDRTSAFVGFRVKKLSGETYGRGPSMDAVSAAGTINQALYDEIVSANFSALPMYMGFDDGVFNPNNFKMIPNTILACAPTASGTWPLQPIPPAGSIQWGQLVIADLREQINRILLTDPFGPIDDPKKTATEIIERQRQILENASAQFSRLQRELFDPFVERVIDILRRKGIWDDVEVDGELIAIKYETPLVTSEGQKEVLEVLQHVQFLQTVFGPEATAGFYRIEELSGWAAQKMNIDLDIIKTKQEIILQLEEVAKQQQQMADQAANQEIAPPEPVPM
jgi:hypothetical protein